MGEFSFQAKFEKADELHPKVKHRAEEFFRSLQKNASDWVSLGTTKTGVVYRLKDRALESLRPGILEIQALLDELKQCYERASRLTPADCKPRACFKTEHNNPDHPHVDLKIYTNHVGASGHGHDVAGLIVALPGKASLMFDVAREVARLIP